MPLFCVTVKQKSQWSHDTACLSDGWIWCVLSRGRKTMILLCITRVITVTLKCTADETTNISCGINGKLTELIIYTTQLKKRNYNNYLLKYEFERERYSVMNGTMGNLDTDF